jgi:hypothetical protein
MSLAFPFPPHPHRLQELGRMACSDSEFNFFWIYESLDIWYYYLGHTSMSRAGFEPTIPVFERSNTVRALDRAATGTAPFRFLSALMYTSSTFNE